MMEPSGNKEEWHQSVLAAIEMADNSSHEISYLLPPKTALASIETAALLLGENPAVLDSSKQ